jgi:type II secretory pathway pseudopilin PulG
MYSKKSKASGFNLIEVAIVLGVIGLVIGGIWIAAAAVSRNVKVQAAEVMFNSVVSGVFAMYKNMPTPGVNTNLDAAVTAAGFVPRDLVNAAGTDFVNPWNGAVNVNIITSGPIYARVWLYEVPHGDECVRLAGSIMKTYSTYLNPSSGKPRLMSFLIGSSMVSDNVMGTPLGYDLILQQIIGYCTGSASTDMSARFFFP